MNFNKHLVLFFSVPATLAFLSLIAIGVWGLKPGIDLAGGSLTQVTYSEARPEQAVVATALTDIGFKSVRVQPIGTDGYTIRTATLTPTEHAAELAALAKLGASHEDLFTSISPTLGTELFHKSLVAALAVMLAIIAFIAFAFRSVSRPVASWKYGIIAIITLAHDVVVPMGLFAILGHFMGAEVDSLFIVALLTILGISINDKIVVFDRVRENLRNLGGHLDREPFNTIVGKSMMQTLGRSINTSVAVVILLVALAILGPASTQYFAITLTVGMVVGTYSSFFLAAPLLVVAEKFGRKNKK